MNDTEERWIVTRLTRNMDVEYLTSINPPHWHNNEDRVLLFFKYEAAQKVAARLGAAVQPIKDSPEWRSRRWLRAYEEGT